MLPCLLFEDEHLLVVHKPAGLNAHAPAPFAGEGLYDWLRHREPRWAALALIHRLDKDTSGVMVFAKTPLANRALTEQFSQRKVRKKYLLLTDRPVKRGQSTVVSALVRVGERYVSRPLHAGGERAETRFAVVPPSAALCSSSSLVLQPRMIADEHEQEEEGRGRSPLAAVTFVEAEPLTGRTHQIRVHAADQGFPVLGDTLYGGTPAARVFLHAPELTLSHPATGVEMAFRAPADFEADARLALRQALTDPAETDAYRLRHGAADGWPGWYVDRLGEVLLSQSEQALAARQKAALEKLLSTIDATRHPQPTAAAYHKTLPRQLQRSGPAEACPRHVLGRPAPDHFAVRENGVRFELSFRAGGSVGLFLDQRDNRRRLRANHVAAGFPVFAQAGPAARVSGGPDTGPTLLNTFAYTCGFSVCAALAGARTTSLDLSKNYLEWGRRNFRMNGLDPAAHEFLVGDVFDWLRRLAKQGRPFDALVLDPPTFSQSKASGVFRAEKDYGRLVGAALPLLRPAGVLFASTNAATLKPPAFLATIATAIRAAGRRITQQHYAPQPPDFPITRAEPAYLKTVWLRIE